MLPLQLARRYDKQSDRRSSAVLYSFIGVSLAAGALGLITLKYVLFLSAPFSLVAYMVYRRWRRPSDPDRGLYRQLAAQRAPRLLRASMMIEGRAGGGTSLKAPLSLRTAILVRHDVIVRGDRVAHCTSGDELLVQGAEVTARVVGPVELDDAPLAARHGRRDQPSLLIDGRSIPLHTLRHVFGERARIEERLVVDGDRIEVRVDPDQLEMVAEAGADAYRTAAVTVLHGRPGHPARVTRPAG